MQYTTLRDVLKPKPIPRKPRKAPQAPPAPQMREPAKQARPKAKAQRRCPSGFRWDSKKGKCVQAGVGLQYRP